MKIRTLYINSLFLGYFLFLIFGISFLLINKGVDDFFGEGIVLLLLAGIIYIPMFALSNLTQFILIIKPNKELVVFFSSILIIGIICFIGIKLNMIDDFLWKLILPAQFIVSVLGLYCYKKKIRKS